MTISNNIVIFSPSNIPEKSGRLAVVKNRWQQDFNNSSQFVINQSEMKADGNKTSMTGSYFVLYQIFLCIPKMVIVSDQSSEKASPFYTSLLCPKFLDFTVPLFS